MQKAYLFLFLVLVTPGIAANLWQTHGHNYSYTSPTAGKVTIFPVAWDIRSANDLILTWQSLYNRNLSDIIHNILEESQENGFNSAIVRSELTVKWFPEIPGLPGDDFFPLATEIQRMGLNLFVGGMKTELDEWKHNGEVIDYLSRYIEMTEGMFDGEVIGCFAFDEPDVKYLEDPDQSENWLEFVAYWNEVVRTELLLPVMCYHAKYATLGPGGQHEYYSDTTSVLNRMARYTDMIAIDMYPAKNNFRRTDNLEYTHGIPVFTAVTDLIQTCQYQSEAFNNKDEVISVLPSGDSALVLVETIDFIGMDLSLNTAWSTTLPFMPDEVYSSDFRSGYYPSGGSENVNSAVVFRNDSLSIDETPVLVSRDGFPEFAEFIPFHGSDQMTPVFFSVGQTDYWRDILEIEGIIGRGRLAILACLQDDEGDYYLMLYAASNSSPVRLYPVFPEPSKINFKPFGAVWGTFWGTWYQAGTTQRLVQNGFVVYDDIGDYVAITQLNRDDWRIYPASGSIQYHNLFGSTQMPDFIKVSHVDGTAPSFFDGYDRLVGYYSEENRIVSARSSYSGGVLNLVDTISVCEFPGEVTSFDFLRNDHRYQDRSVFTLNNTDVYLGTSGFESSLVSGEITAGKINYCYGDTIISGFRTMHTRDAIRSVLIAGESGYSIPQCEIYDDVYDGYRFQWFPEAFQVGFNNGVLSTDRDNSLFAVIQSFGQHAFALPSYCASADTMLYMVTAPIVAGARGLVFYALDISMMSGNGGDDGTSRAPFVLQNWGPSRDNQNTDMVGIVHQAVARITGNNGGTNYIEKLIDPNWRIMDESEIFNTLPIDTLLNFIALKNQQEDSIIVIAVNESLSNLTAADGISVTNLPATAEIVSSEGFTPILVNSSGTSSTYLDFSGMNAVSASLFTISTRRAAFNGNSWKLESHTNSNGNNLISYTVPLNSYAELALFDITGRRVELLWNGNGAGVVVENLIEKDNYPAGLYFVTLSSDNIQFSAKCLLW